MKKTKEVKVRVRKKYVRTSEKVVKTAMRQRMNVTALVFWVCFKNPEKWCSVNFIRTELAKDGVTTTIRAVTHATRILAGVVNNFVGVPPRDELLMRKVDSDLNRNEFKFNPEGTIRVKSTKNVLGKVTYHKTKKAVLVQRSFKS